MAWSCSIISRARQAFPWSEQRRMRDSNRRGREPNPFSKSAMSAFAPVAVGRVRLLCQRPRLRWTLANGSN